jgi:hypothetical protein
MIGIIRKIINENRIENFVLTKQRPLINIYGVTILILKRRKL